MSKTINNGICNGLKDDDMKERKQRGLNDCQFSGQCTKPNAESVPIYVNAVL